MTPARQYDGARRRGSFSVAKGGAMRGGIRILTVIAASALLALAGGVSAQAAAPPAGRYPSPLTAADVAGLAAGATQRSIVVLRDQHPSLPARGATAGSRAHAI